MLCRENHVRGNVRRNRALAKLAAILVLLAGSLVERAHADNGDILLACDQIEAEVGAKTVDIEFVSMTGEFVVLGESGVNDAAHQLTVLNQDCVTATRALANPHPSGAIAQNNLTLNRGVAFHSLFRRLYVLSAVGSRTERTFTARAVDLDGNTIPGAEFTIDTGDPRTDLRGLAFDPARNEFFTLDAGLDRVYRVNLGGDITLVLDLPGKDRPDAKLRGSGIAFDSEDLSLFITYGDVLSPGPRKIVEIDPAGELIGENLVGTPTGVEIPLSAIDSSDIRGIVSFRTDQNERRFAVIGNENIVFHLEHTISDPLPPTGLTYALDSLNQVRLSWTSNGSLAAGAYGGSLTILRNDVALATIVGDAHSFVDENPVNGQTTYAVRATNADGDASDISCPCNAFVGAGGVVDWAIAPDGQIQDVARNDSTGEIYASSPATGKVYRLDESLQLIPDAVEIDPGHDNPTGIAYLRSITLGFTLPGQPDNTTVETDVLAVSDAEGPLLRLVKLETGTPISTISLRFPAEFEGSPQISSLTYVPSDDASEQRFICTEKTTGQIFVFQRSGNLIHQCVPTSVFFQFGLGCGITYDELQGTILTATDDGIVREFFAEGNPGSCGLADPDYEVSLASTGSAFATQGHIGGIQIADNTLLVAVPGSGTIFRLLLYADAGRLFVRGDVNSDGLVNITDIVRMLAFLFQAGDPISCLDAADFNDDGRVRISDAQYGIEALFKGGPPPPAPYPEAGFDRTFRDEIGCESTSIN